MDIQRIKSEVIPDFEFLIWSGDCGRFIRLVEATWIRLPHEIKNEISGHFKGIGVFKAELSNLWESSRGDAWASTEYDRIKALPDLIEKANDEAACYVLAHEFAHVYQRATKALDEKSREENEEEADNLAKLWGFDYDAFSNFKIEEFLLSKGFNLKIDNA